MPEPITPRELKIDRRAFGTMLVALSASAAAQGQKHEAGTMPEIMQEAGLVAPVSGPVGSPHETLHSGTFSPGPAGASTTGRVSRKFLSGTLTAGNIQFEMHETVQEPGAVHEPVGTHKHNEIWCVKRGTASLFINDVEHRMSAGDIGLVTAGDRHWIKNIGKDQLAYFVITVGPPE
jgi:quercetin dioxygenase-like cupin family protein